MAMNLYKNRNRLTDTDREKKFIVSKGERGEQIRSMRLTDTNYIK